MRKSLIFLAVGCLTAASFVVAQLTCPCSYDPDHQCETVVYDETTDTCDTMLVSCPCYCDYSGNNDHGMCPLDVGLGYRFTAKPACILNEFTFPDCGVQPVPPNPEVGEKTPFPTTSVAPEQSEDPNSDDEETPTAAGSVIPTKTQTAKPSRTPSATPSPSLLPTPKPSQPSEAPALSTSPRPSSTPDNSDDDDSSPTPAYPSGQNKTRSYLCTDYVVLEGAGSFVCTLPPLPCEQVIETRFVYWQSASYTAALTFGPGTAIYTLDIQVINEPEPAGWIPSGIPGAHIQDQGSFEGPDTIVRTFDANETLSVYGSDLYNQALMENCVDKGNVNTDLVVMVSFTNKNGGANYQDTDPYGLRTITQITVEAVVQADDDD